MEKYENLGVIGEGSYGLVLKCKHKESGQIVAIKKFLASDEESSVKKIAMREIRLLKQLRHDNLVNLVEVFRRRKRLYLVFEYVEHSLLNEMDAFPHGMNANSVRKYMWQLLQALDFCHSRNIIHRDIKPENILTSAHGVLKLCDFGFARSLSGNEKYTEYVATRWYRSPELLVADPHYGKPVDIWAAGCLFVEMLTGEPLFAGDSDIDQLHHIVRCFGSLCPNHVELMQRNPAFASFRFPDPKKLQPMEQRMKVAPQRAIDFAKYALEVDPEKRGDCKQLCQHVYFTCDSFVPQFSFELEAAISKDLEQNPLLAKKRQNRASKTDLKDAIKMVQGGLLSVTTADSVIRRSAPSTPMADGFRDSSIGRVSTVDGMFSGRPAASAFDPGQMSRMAGPVALDTMGHLGHAMPSLQSPPLSPLLHRATMAAQPPPWMHAPTPTHPLSSGSAVTHSSSTTSTASTATFAFTATTGATTTSTTTTTTFGAPSPPNNSPPPGSSSSSHPLVLPPLSSINSRVPPGPTQVRRSLAGGGVPAGGMPMLDVSPKAKFSAPLHSDV